LKRFEPFTLGRAKWDPDVLAWLRRIIISVGVGGASYAIMLAIMVLSVVYDRQMEPVITFAFDTGRWITDTLDLWVVNRDQSSARAGQHDPCRAIDPSYHHSCYIRRHSIK